MMPSERIQDMLDSFADMDPDTLHAVVNRSSALMGPLLSAHAWVNQRTGGRANYVIAAALVVVVAVLVQLLWWLASAAWAVATGVAAGAGAGAGASGAAQVDLDTLGGDDGDGADAAKWV